MSVDVREAVIGIGTNLGDRSGQIEAARVSLLATSGIESVEIGPVIETEPVLPDDVEEPHPWYLNTVAIIRTRLSPEVLMGRLLAIEANLGRRRSGSVLPRTLDLDLLLLGKERRNTPGLTIPHPRMWSRSFVREPLEALRPGLLAEAEIWMAQNDS